MRKSDFGDISFLHWVILCWFSDPLGAHSVSSTVRNITVGKARVHSPGIQPQEVLSGWTPLRQKSGVLLHWGTPRCGQQLAGSHLRESFPVNPAHLEQMPRVDTSTRSWSFPTCSVSPHLGTDCYFSFVACSLLFKNKTNQHGWGQRLHLADSASGRN